jgi:hypothetical protein
VLRTGGEIQPLADAKNRMLPYERCRGKRWRYRIFPKGLRSVGINGVPLTSWKPHEDLSENIVPRFERFIGCFCSEAAILDASVCTLHPGLSLKESASWDRME